MAAQNLMQAYIVQQQTARQQAYERIVDAHPIYYKDLIEHAEIVDNVDHNLPRDAVTLGSIVVVKDLEEDAEDRYEIVGSQEANPREGRISDDSPVGKGLIGHRAGESLSIPVPSGEIRLQIVSVENT